jgi:hypothetical protein
MSLLTTPNAFKVKASSALQSHAAKNMFDGNADTCWNSNNGSPQFIVLDFLNNVEFESIRIIFQGGFVGQEW